MQVVNATSTQHRICGTREMLFKKNSGPIVVVFPMHSHMPLMCFHENSSGPFKKDYGKYCYENSIDPHLPVVSGTVMYGLCSVSDCPPLTAKSRLAGALPHWASSAGNEHRLSTQAWPRGQTALRLQYAPNVPPLIKQ